MDDPFNIEEGTVRILLFIALVAISVFIITRKKK